MFEITTCNHFFLAYTLVKEEAGCINDGGVLAPGGKVSIAKCSDECNRKAPMFVFGRNGTLECNGVHCTCWCSTRAFPNGTCILASKPQFDTYKINKGKATFGHLIISKVLHACDFYFIF